VIKNPAAARLPHTFVSCTHTQADRLTLDPIAARVRAEGWGYYEVAADHMAMLTAPKELTEVLLSIGQAAGFESC